MLYQPSSSFLTSGQFVANPIRKIGSYTVLGNLGRGAHSSILHVRRNEDSREYALKIVNIDGPEEFKFLDQATHEFRVAALLDHPTLIRIYALECRKNWLFKVKKVEMLIELVNGKTLDETPPLTMPKLIPVCSRIASGLVHMHRRGVYHGDLKPNNILLGKRGEVKVIDYGLATLRGEPRNRVQGTPEYMAPETARSKVVDESSDIYNFGATMYRLATLKLPPSMITVGPGELVPMSEKTARMSIVAPRSINRTIPAAFDKLILDCLAYKPENRPERVSDVLEILRELAKEQGELLDDSSAQ